MRKLIIALLMIVAGTGAGIDYPDCTIKTLQDNASLPGFGLPFECDFFKSLALNEDTDAINLYLSKLNSQGDLTMFRPGEPVYIVSTLQDNVKVRRAAEIDTWYVPQSFLNCSLIVLVRNGMI